MKNKTTYYITGNPSKEILEQEIKNLDDAIEQGDYKPLVFNDRHDLKSKNG